MRKCLWCSRSEPTVTYDKEAHTIPQSIGGKLICEDVCDECNTYFGTKGAPAVEVVLGEAFKLSNALILDVIGERGKNKIMPRHKSIFFTVDFERKRIKSKSAYAMRPHFQEKLGRQFRRGIYKVFLEELHRETFTGKNDEFNFIREFARYDLNDLPVFYFKQKLPMLLFSIEEFRRPEVNFNDDKHYVMKEQSFYHFRLMGHQFAIAVKKNYKMHFDSYLEYLKGTSYSKVYKELQPVVRFEDFDFLHRFMDDNLSS